MSAFSAAADDEDGDTIRTLRAENEMLRQALRSVVEQALEALTCTGEHDDPGHRCTHCDDYVDRNGPTRAALRAALEQPFFALSPREGEACRLYAPMQHSNGASALRKDAQ